MIGLFTTVIDYQRDYKLDQQTRVRHLIDISTGSDRGPPPTFGPGAKEPRTVNTLTLVLPQHLQLTNAVQGGCLLWMVSSVGDDDAVPLAAHRMAARSRQWAGDRKDRQVCGHGVRFWMNLSVTSRYSRH